MRDIVQYKSGVRTKLQMMGVLRKFEELYKKNLSFDKSRHEVDDLHEVLISPTLKKKPDNIANGQLLFTNETLLFSYSCKVAQFVSGKLRSLSQSTKYNQIRNHSS